MLRNLCFTIVALEYFTKWIKAKAVWQKIICCFEVLSYITVDNGTQFNCTKFKNFCSELGIKLAFASVNHLESNGAVKRVNGLIFNAVSKALFDSLKGKMGAGVDHLCLGT
jgi:IS30 family transposase